MLPKPLRFLTAPLKWLKILLLVTFILFGSSIALQIYFHQPDLLQQEMDATEKLGQQSLWKQWAQDIATDDRIKNQSATGINLILTKHIYHAFSTILYEWIPVNYLLSAQPATPVTMQKSVFWNRVTITWNASTKQSVSSPYGWAISYF